MFPQIDTPNAGPLTERDLDQARQHSTGRIYHLPRVTVAGRDTCNGRCETASGCDCHGIESCAPEGGTFADPVPSGLVSMRRHRDIRDTVALVIALAVTGYAFHLVWPLVA